MEGDRATRKSGLGLVTKKIEWTFWLDQRQPRYAPILRHVFYSAREGGIATKVRFRDRAESALQLKERRRREKFLEPLFD